jgi:hypothetical protein
MKKFPLIVVGITLIIFVGGIFLFSRKPNTPENLTPPPLPTSYEYFWGDGCPHCAVVEEFLSTWEGKGKIVVEKKEVWKNTANANLLSQRADYCNLDKNNLGVPFLFTPDGKCLSGDTPIIDYFKSLKIEN